MYIAKFPSRNDEYNVGLWAHFCHLLAKRAGINAAETHVLSTNEHFHTLLSKRFDRTSDGKRVHFASAMTLLGLTDRNNATSGLGYLDIVDFIIRGCSNVEDNLQELYRRVAFNIAVGNCDDHFRNHGFLLTATGWTLCRAYDMNPMLTLEQSLLINASTNRSDLSILRESCGEYLLEAKVADRIIKEVNLALIDLRKDAIRLGIAKREIDLFSGKLDKNRD